MAASAVVIYHTELYKSQHHQPHFLDLFPGLENFGQMAVNFFFVLSGFLITTLMIHEEKNSPSKSIHLKNFYMRRILRIWPPYFTCLILAFLVFPLVPFFNGFRGQPSTFGAYVAYITLFPNMVGPLWGTVHDINHLWSIGVEEQFYLIWPWLMRNTRKSLRWILLILLFFLFSKLMIRVFLETGTFSLNEFKRWNGFLSCIRIQCMAIGALGAYAWAFHPKACRPFFNGTIQRITYAITTYLLISNTRISTINDEVYCTLFLIIILNVSLNPNSLFHFKQGFYKALGNASYAMYIFHMFVIYSFFKLFPDAFSSDSSWVFLVQHLTILLFTTLTALFSYHTIEKFFILLKYRYASSTAPAP